MENEWKWDWWSESPIEIIVVVLFLAIFFAFPLTGLGITPTAENAAPTAVAK